MGRAVAFVLESITISENHPLRTPVAAVKQGYCLLEPNVYTSYQCPATPFTNSVYQAQMEWS